MTGMLWPTPDQYQAMRQAVVEAGWGKDIAWQESVGRPETPKQMAEEIIWVIINSGMNHRITRAIGERVHNALAEEKPVIEAFGHPGKARAIEYIWSRRQALWEELLEVPDEDLPTWCLGLPWVGPTTCFHAAKNLGGEVAKPDRWLLRLAAQTGEDVQGFCRRIARASGDRIPTVDLVLWAAASEGLVTPED